MAKNPTLCAAAEGLDTDSVTALLNSGYLRLYTGTQPASPDVALSGQTLLAELGFASTAFGASVDGVATANGLSQETSAPASGKATWARAVTNAGTAIFDGTVGTSDADLILDVVTIAKNARVSVTSLTLSTFAPSVSPSISASRSSSISESRSTSVSTSPSASISASPSISTSSSPSVSASKSPSSSESRSESSSASSSSSKSPSSSGSSSDSSSASSSASISPSVSPSPSV